MVTLILAKLHLYFVKTSSCSAVMEVVHFAFFEFFQCLEHLRRDWDKNMIINFVESVNQ